MTALSTDLDLFVELTREKRSHDQQSKAIADELKALGAKLIDQFTEEGVRGKRTTDGVSVSIRRQVWARAAEGDKPAACEALKTAGLEDFVSEGFNTHALSAYFRELVKDREAEGQVVDDLQALLPEALRGRIDLTEDAQLGVRGA